MADNPANIVSAARESWPGQERRSGMRTRSREPIGPQDWCSLFLRRCGLTFRDAQVAAMLRLVDEQMRARGITDPAVYHALLSEEREGSIEWNELLEGVLNHETSFFRHPASFDALRNIILPDLLNQRVRGAYLSFWSAGCSTGQETYSLAMLGMADEEIAGRFTVWGSDVSRRVIDIARLGRYGARTLAGLNPSYRQRFLREIQTDRGVEYEIVPELRERVRFIGINLFSASDFSPRHDVIFCHNVLIYFAPEAATRLLNALATRLRPGSYRLLGPGEGPGDQPPGLEPLHVPGVRGFRRTRQAGTERRS
jgi:chemotaxis methyl-accepting protein methylase